SEPRVERRGAQGRLARLDRAADLVLQQIERLPGLLARFRVEPAQRLHHAGDAALLAESLDARTLERVEIARRTDGGKQLALHVIEIFHAALPAFRRSDARRRRSRPTKAPAVAGP